MWMPRRKLLSWKIGGKGKNPSKYEKVKSCYRDLLGGQFTGRAMSCPPPISVVLISDVVRFFIPFPTFFIFVPGKDRVLMRWIFVLLLKSRVFQLIAVHLLSREDVLSSVHLLLYHNLWNEVSLSPAPSETQQMQLCSAEGTAGHSWATPAEVPGAAASLHACPCQPTDTCNDSCWLPNSFIFFLIFLHWPCIYIPALLLPSRFYDQVRFTLRTKPILGV